MFLDVLIHIEELKLGLISSQVDNMSFRKAFEENL
jgi:hypothetical protein